MIMIIYVLCKIHERFSDSSNKFYLYEALFRSLVQKKNMKAAARATARRLSNLKPEP